jgi:hypothetical protein
MFRQALASYDENRSQGTSSSDAMAVSSQKMAGAQV